MSDSILPDTDAETPGLDPDMPMNALGLDEPPLAEKLPEKPATVQPYRVLARKYRPQMFAELIGQDAMVQTLGNAIKRDKLAHAFLMTGVRGVGKTSTARLIAKALNCIGPNGKGGPTISPCGVCEPCIAIAEGRHIDVIEMDAASHTGVDDVREIIEAVRYSAVSARYKIYIIDEVHMLSKNAFNALLKTLEEPPAHVKFLFATTEVNKIPITVLSRCQRFDLKRISSEQLADHFAKICHAEAVTADADALAMIAEAAQGSVRDGLSILDQAIAHTDLESDADTPQGEAQVRAALVREMLGLSDRDAVRRLFGHVIAGDADQMLQELDSQHMLGVDSLAIMRGLLELVHSVTLQKSTSTPRNVHNDAERAALSKWSGALSHAQLHRLWQLLLKGHDEVEQAPVPREACEMALLRVAHASTLPDPGQLARLLRDHAGNTPDAPKTETASPSHEPSAQQSPPREADTPIDPVSPVKPDAASAQRADIHSLESLNAALLANGKYLLSAKMAKDMQVVEFREGAIIYQSADGRDDYAPELRDALLQITGKRWTLEKGEGEAGLTLAQQEQAHAQARKDARDNHPLVKAVMQAFPDAKIIENDTPTGDTSSNIRSLSA